MKGRVDMDRISHAVYLIDDNEHPFSGWEFDNRGLDISKRGSYAQFNFEKVHPEFDTLLKRKFRVQSDSVVTLETNFVIDCPDGFSVKLYDSDGRTAVGIVTCGGSFALCDGTKTGIDIVAQPAKNSFKAVIDLKKRTYSVIINNKDAGTHSLNVYTSNLEYITIGIEKGYVGSLSARGVKLYADYLCNERFLAPFEGDTPCDWIFESDKGSGKITYSADHTFSKEDTYYYTINSEGGYAVLERSVSGLPGEYCLELKFIDKSEDLDASFKLNNMGIRAANGILYLTDGRMVCKYPKNLWNTLRLEFAAGKMLVRLNGKDRGIFELDTSEKISPENVQISVNGNSVLGLDDILLFALDPLPKDYVPKPEPVNGTGYHVGLHVCSLWRYGFWRGTHDATWDVCTPYDEITPYMGYYDEGIPEVADWETKWFCEHGIDFQLQCWYGPENITEPIKFPGFSFALHDGYFNSVYKKYSKFAIMWENNFTRQISPEAFEKYLVPFFMEYYFKDPCYYCIDGKPVFSIYNIRTLVSPGYFGSVEQARKELDFLREAVKKEGFSDIILLCAGGGSSKEEIELREALGVDGTYAYNWGTSSYTSEYQEEMLSGAAERFAKYAKSVVHVPTVGVGFNCVARHDKRYPSISIDEYEKILNWTKSVYLTDKRNFPDQSSWQSKMLLLSCWNEFDEGHYINPSNLHGFGFIDTIRKLFTDGGEHIDEKPTENQKKRIDILFPQGHSWLRPERRLEVPKADKDAKTVKVWDFSDASTYDKWNYYTNAHDKKHSNGRLYGTSDGIDPQIILDGNADFSADDVDFIRVSALAKSGEGKVMRRGFQIFYATEDSPNLSGNKMLSESYEQERPDGLYDMYFSCADQGFWRGNITIMRIDPLSGAGSWEIESVALIKSSKPKTCLFIDGQNVSPGLPVPIINGVPFIPLFPKNEIMNKLTATYSWNRTNKVFVLIIGQTQMKFTAGSDICVLDAETNIKLPGEVPLVDGVPAVPLDTVCNICGYKYSFDNGDIFVTTN